MYLCVRDELIPGMLLERLFDSWDWCLGTDYDAS